MERKEVREKYGIKVCEKLGKARMTAGEETSVNVVFKDVVTTVAAEILGYRVSRDRVKGCVWWTDKIEV